VHRRGRSHADRRPTVFLFGRQHIARQRPHPGRSGRARCARTERGWGRTVILSDGDVVFQPRKVERSGIFEAVEGHVLIYIHKEAELDDVVWPLRVCDSRLR